MPLSNLLFYTYVKLKAGGTHTDLQHKIFQLEMDHQYIVHMLMVGVFAKSNQI